MMDLYIQFQNYVNTTFAFAFLIIATRFEVVRNAIAQTWENFLFCVKFFADAFTESSGKTSYSRLAGTYVLIKITTATVIPDAWIWLFNVLIGYQLISGLLKDNPALMELVKAYASKVVPQKEGA